MTSPQDELAVRLGYDEVADTYADHFRTTELKLPVELAMIGHFAPCLPAIGESSTPVAAPAGCCPFWLGWVATSREWTFRRE